MPWAGRSENADRRRTDGRGDMQKAQIVRNGGLGGGEGQDGVAQVMSSQVADPVGRRCGDLGRQVPFAGAADHPNCVAFGR